MWWQWWKAAQACSRGLFPLGRSERRDCHALEGQPLREGAEHQTGFLLGTGLRHQLLLVELSNKQLYVVLRDVAKAFHKVWHNGLKYKLINLGLPDIINCQPPISIITS